MPLTTKWGHRPGWGRDSICNVTVCSYQTCSIQIDITFAYEIHVAKSLSICTWYYLGQWEMNLWSSEFIQLLRPVCRRVWFSHCRGLCHVVRNWPQGSQLSTWFRCTQCAEPTRIPPILEKLKWNQIFSGKSEASIVDPTPYLSWA